MSICRVYQRPDGSVAVVHPNPALEDDTKAFALTERADPSLVGLLFAEVDTDTLPDRSTRHRWRLENGAVTLGPEPPNPVAAQRKEDAALSLNNAAIRATQAQRDAFARLIGCKPLTIPLTQDATAADIGFL